MKITENFIREEFDSHDGVKYPSNWINSRLSPLCMALEKIRVLTGQPIHILSGYRSPAWNAHVRGAGHSQHVQGRAADLILVGMSIKQLHKAIILMIKSKAIPDGGLGLYSTWVHYDIGPAGRRWTGTIF